MADPQPPPVNAGKERRKPSVTPRKFKKFFTPRSHGSQYAASRRALDDITAPINNQGFVHSSPLRPLTPTCLENDNSNILGGDLKRRKIVQTPEASPQHLSDKRRDVVPENGKIKSHDMRLEASPCQRVRRRATFLGQVDDVEEMDFYSEAYEVPKPVESLRRMRRAVRVTDSGLGRRLLDLSLGNSIQQRHDVPVTDYQEETASFYTRPSDMHTCTSIETGSLCIPFCAAGCNTNTLTAIGDEEGRVRLLESGRNQESSLREPWISFRVHTNAIIDMCFSDDDALLATASGDSTARVVDMTTQTTIGIFGNHMASLKQVRFQPGAHNKSVLATSSRDGSVQIWDLRCKGRDGPMNELSAPVLPHRTTTRSQTQKILFGVPVNTIYDAHKAIGSLGQINPASSDNLARGEVFRRVGDVSVTAIEFLPHRENLILTGSEADASVKLWDIRAFQSKRKSQTPLSVTARPPSHLGNRDYGITSMNISTNGGRLYTVCKDSTIYAYSTAHLMLGSAPELESSSEGRKAPIRLTQEGSAPLYGFRHPNLHASSFYIKSSIRKAKDDKTELLAVGSSDKAAVLFPLDERYLSTLNDPVSQNYSLLSMSQEQSRRGSVTNMTGRSEDKLPVSHRGTALRMGHDREVGSVTWNSDGELVTVGDDFVVRVWREGADARDLRTGGNSDGRRWACGWAEVSANFDDED